MFGDVAARYTKKYIKPNEDGWLRRFESKFRRQIGIPSSVLRPCGDARAADPARAVITRPLPQGVLTPAEVDRICLEEKRTQFLIEGLLPANGIAIAAGESSIGKSALICQLGLSVAAGVPFLGMKTVPGPVLYFDLENSIFDCKAMRDSLVGFLRLDRTPDDFLLTQEPLADLNEALDKVRPKLVVIDSLRAFRPDVTDRNARAAEWLMEIRKLSRTYECTFLIVHHLRKPSRDSASPDLEACNVAAWLLDMEGPRAFVNQTDVRLAITEGDLDPAALKLKWSRRVRGDSPVVLIERIFDGDGDPVGYRHLMGADLLSPEKRAAFDRLASEFSTAEAKTARQACGLGGGNDPTNKFLAECKQLGLIEKLERGRWRKLAVQNQ
jgi:hypothetical protein